MRMTPPHAYLTHDNGGRPFKVLVTARPRQFWVLRGAEHGYDKMVVQPTEYARLFVGKSPRNRMTAFSGAYGREFDGNSVLFQLADGMSSYMFVGESIMTFKAAPGDVIRSYTSPVGNNDVPYPYAVGDKFTYVIREKVRIPNAALTKAQQSNPYHFLYDDGCEATCSGCSDAQPCYIDSKCVRSCADGAQRRNKAVGVKSMRARVVHKRV